MRSVTRLRAAALSVAGLTALATLSACGELHPGIAIEAGDQTVTLSRVDDITQDICTVIQSDGQSKGRYAMETVRRSVVRALATRVATEQLAEEYDVGPGADYAASVKDYETNLTAVPDDVLARAMDVLTSQTYIQDVLQAVGKIELAREGKPPTNATDTAAKGGEVLGAWIDEHGIEVDPRFDLSFSGEGIESTRKDTSFALSDFATKAMVDEPTDEFVNALPPSQRCG